MRVCIYELAKNVDSGFVAVSGWGEEPGTVMKGDVDNWRTYGGLGAIPPSSLSPPNKRFQDHERKRGIKIKKGKTVKYNVIFCIMSNPAQN